EIELLLNSLQPISRLPGIDPQARMMLLWLSSDPLAKVVLDELDKLLRKPSLESVNGIIAFLDQFPGAVPPRTSRDRGGTALNRVSEPLAEDLLGVGHVQFEKQHWGGVHDEPGRGLGAARQAVVMPILVEKGWTRCKWAARAGVSKNSVYDYLNGKR